MDIRELKLKIGFYENELLNNILPFWLKNCEDKENGGYVNCFTNDGSELISKDKYVWSQGRFLWLFSKMAGFERPFTKEMRKEFLRLAKQGRDFLVKNVFMEVEPFRCYFLLDETGKPKYVEGFDRLDMSIYADGFILDGLNAYAVVSGDRETYEIAKRLFDSVINRFETYNYCTLPYPISDSYTMHGFYMVRIHYCYNMYLSAKVFEPDIAPKYLEKLRESVDNSLKFFADSEGNVREVVYRDGSRVSGIFGNHINPGHTLEEMWFMLHAADLLEDESYTEKLVKIIKRTLEIGWDKEFGGIYHFICTDGAIPVESDGDPKDEVIYKQLIGGWGDKLWWVHSEALYCLLLFSERTGDEELKEWYNKIFDYVYSVFPNPDREVREWVQIRTREGKPQEAVVALPVKDPMHIARNMLYILRFLYSLEK